jgi:hypothetical protein
MTQPEPVELTQSSDELDKRVRLYRDMGFTAEKTVVQGSTTRR